MLNKYLKLRIWDSVNINWEGKWNRENKERRREGIGEIKYDFEY